MIKLVADMIYQEFIQKWSVFTILKCVMYVVGLIVLGCLVLKEFYPIVDEYENNNLGTYVDIQHLRRFDHAVKVPALMLCIPRSSSLIENTVKQLGHLSPTHDPNCEVEEKLDYRLLHMLSNASFENISCQTKNDIIYHYQHSVLIPLLQYLLQNGSDDFQVLSLENFSWNQMVINAVWDLFTCIFLHDKHYHFAGHQSYYWCINNSDVIDQYIANKPRLEKLFYRLVDVVCDHVTYSDIVEEPRQMPKETCMRSLQQNHTVFFTNFFCFTLPLNDSGLTTVVDANGKSGHWTALNGSVYFPSQYRPSFDIYYQQGEIFSNTYLQVYHTLYKSAEQADSVYIQYSLPFGVREDRKNAPCYLAPTQFECKNQCMIKKIVNACHCIPFSFRTRVDDSPDFPYCSSARYAECKIDLDLAIQDCDNYCVNPCLFVPFQWMLSRSTLYIKPERRMFALTIKRMGTVHVELHTTVKTSRAVLLTQLLAIINFYFGFSGFTIITGIICCIRLLRRRIAQRKVSATDSQMKIDGTTEKNMKPNEENSTGHKTQDFMKAQQAEIEDAQQTLKAIKYELGLMNLELAMYRLQRYQGPLVAPNSVLV